MQRTSIAAIKALAKLATFSGQKTVSLLGQHGIFIPRGRDPIAAIRSFHEDHELLVAFMRNLISWVLRFRLEHNIITVSPLKEQRGTS